MWERKKARHEGRRQQCNSQSTTNLYPANRRSVGPRLNELQRMWFGEGGERTYFLYLAKTSFRRYSARKASLHKIGDKPTGTT